MHPVIFQWGSIQIYSYGLMLGLAFLAGILWVNKEAKKEGLNRDDLFTLIIVIVVTSLLGARLTYVFLFWEHFQNDLPRILAFRDGGLVFQGGFLAALLASYIFVKWKRYYFWQLADVFSPALALGYAFARIGCFLNGCCYGVTTGSSCGVLFPGMDPIPRHPTQLYACGAVLLIFFILVWLRRYKIFHGYLFLWFLILYGVYRFIIEFYRVNPPFLGALSFAQVVALIFIVFGIPILIWKSKGKNKPGVR